MSEEQLTPMMRQYRAIKGQHKDAVLFFRLGDFYEMFEYDARDVSRILNITLTQRHGIPMCGIPYHAAQSYIPRLLKAGRKIAICEQTELPQGGKGIAERKVVEIITPGTVVDEDFLDSKTNNYLLSLAKCAENGSLAWVDLSTGELCCCAFPWTEAREVLRREFARMLPREIIVQESLHDQDPTVRRLLAERRDLTVNRYPDWNYGIEESYSALVSHFKTASLKAFGITEHEPAIFACGVLLDYLQETAKTFLTHIRSISLINDSDYLGLDDSTQRNLEILTNMQDGSASFTLISVLDHTRTAMGGRLLKKWLLQPLKSRTAIEIRHEAVALLYHNQMLLNRVREHLSGLPDIERLAARIGLDKAHGKDLSALQRALEQVSDTAETLQGWEQQSPLWSPGEKKMTALKDLLVLLDKAVHEDPSVILSDGRLIKKGYRADLDELRDLRENSRRIVDEYLDEERLKSGIQNLKIKYNKIIGYFFDVSKGNLQQVPDYFIRRQTLVNGERFTTDRLIDLESRLNSASEQAVELEKEIFIALRNELKQYIPLLQDMAGYAAVIDVIASFAQAATIYGYTRPLLHDGSGLRIREGRHPVVENHLPPGDFHPNDLDLGTNKEHFALITGPNMAGKSTFLRQNALIVLMAQAGSFVPAAEAEISIVDRIFCRVGASDNLARGESTFLVEMNETAHILRQAGKNSLVIMDEVGRGTGTNDGLAIAWAVSEYLVELKAKTLFATHYHELTRIKKPGLKNLSLEVLENEGEIVFLKKIKQAPSGNSYGLHVARLAGIPQQVIEHARHILFGLLQREKHINALNEQPEPHSPPQQPATISRQDELFPTAELLIAEIKAFDINNQSPLAALNAIAGWKKKIGK